MTLRVLLDGAARSDISEVVAALAKDNGAETVAIDDSTGLPLATWLTFNAGRYEQSPLRLEAIAITNELRGDVRDALFDIADAAVFVVSCTEQALASGAHQLQANRLISDGDQGRDLGVAVFGHRTDPDTAAGADEILEALGLPAETLITFTSPDGDGVRYGFALAVRLGLLRLAERDVQGLDRTVPSSPAEMRSLLLAAAAAEQPAPPAPIKAAGSLGPMKWLARRRRQA